MQMNIDEFSLVSPDMDVLDEIGYYLRQYSYAEMRESLPKDTVKVVKWLRKKALRNAIADGDIGYVYRWCVREHWTYKVYQKDRIDQGRQAKIAISALVFGTRYADRLMKLNKKNS